MESTRFPIRLRRFVSSIASECAATLNVASWFRPRQRFDLTDQEGIRKHFDERGWVIARDVFSLKELAELRAAVKRSVEEGLEGDVLVNPYLGGDAFVLNQRLLSLVKALLPGSPVHFGDATYACGVQTSQAFHKDNPDRRNAAGPDWRSPYSVIRLGLYLQDHSRHSGGLALRDRSHLTPSTTQGAPFAVPTQPGDVVAWFLRTTHSGFATRPRLVPRAFLPLTLMSFLTGKSYSPSKLFFRPLERSPRMALFATFGIHDAHLYRFIRHSKTCHYAVAHWQATRYDERILSELSRSGVDLLDIPSQVSGIPLKGLHQGFVPLPDD